MKCSKVQKKLSAYQDGELQLNEREQVRSHLLICRSCREQFAQLERAWQTLGELQEIRPDPWFYPQLLRKIKELSEKGLFPTLQHVFRSFRAPAIASIILIVGLAAGSYLGGILTRFGLFPSQTNLASYVQGAFFTSVRVFDPAPPGTFAEGYLRMVSHEESESR